MSHCSLFVYSRGNPFTTLFLVPSQPYIVMGMQQDTTYEIRVAAKTAAGVGDFSAPKMDKTKKLVATAAPVLNTAAGQNYYYSTATSLTLFIAALLAANICI